MSRKKIGSLYLSICVFFILVYTVCLLVYYPGVGMNDGLNILMSGMKAGGQFPPVYIMIVTAFRKIGQYCGENYNISIALYSWCQLLFTSVITAGIVVWIFFRSRKKLLLWLSLLYFAFVPVFPIYAISMLKDTPWSLLLAAYVILIYEIVRGEFTRCKWFWILTAIITLGVILLRNNGIYVIVPSLLMLLFFHRSSRLYTGIIFAVGVFAYVLVALVSPKSYFQEKAAIPLQQVCAVVAYDGDMTEEQKEFIGSIMPLEDIKANYDPHSADTIKWNQGFHRQFFEQYKLKFLKVWAEMLPKNFKIYVKAFLNQTFYFWAPVPHETQAFYSIESNSSDGGWPIEFAKEKKIHDAPVITGKLGELLRNYYSYASYFISEGILWWIVVISFICIVVKTKKLKEYFCIYSPLLFLWVSIMLSVPLASSLRYVMAFAYVLPILISFFHVNKSGKIPEY